MKRQALDHTKTDLLMRILAVPRYVAVGILESLWHLTAREAPRGDIGKLSDERIAIGIDWRGAANRTRQHEATRLVQALTEAGWLDSHPTHRLTVHDWPEHADEGVKKYIKRNNLQWACRDMSRLPLPLPVPLPVPLPAPTANETPPPKAVTIEFPKSTEFIKRKFPTTDDAMVRSIVDRAVQEVIGAGEAPELVTDEVLLEALLQCTTKKQYSAALYLNTVGTWMRNMASTE